ncbi:hypothetical protein RSAG8_09396, partial [Rhizoctonia solani AG-8 WAC10335]
MPISVIVLGVMGIEHLSVDNESGLSSSLDGLGPSYQSQHATKQGKA